MPGDNPGFYQDHVTLSVKLRTAVAAKLATFRRQEKPDMTDEEAVAFLIEDSLIRLGLLSLPSGNRSKGDGK